jgi:hypothetical protein
MTTKMCEQCGVYFQKTHKESALQWSKKRFCSQKCAGKHNINRANGGWNKLRHGDAMAGSAAPEYRAWQSMLSRCELPTNTRFARYGGRGIRVCARWHKYELFLSDMGRKPTSGHSIERIDNDGNYAPSNCRWATRHEQAQNMSQTKKVLIDGVSLSLSDWALRIGCSRSGLAKTARRIGAEAAVRSRLIKVYTGDSPCVAPGTGPTSKPALVEVWSGES